MLLYEKVRIIETLHANISDVKPTTYRLKKETPVV